MQSFEGKIEIGGRNITKNGGINTDQCSTLGQISYAEVIHCKGVLKIEGNH